MVYGDCYAAEKHVYQRIKDKITEGITEINDVEFTETKELGKVKKVDPLGITDLRIRGMWHIANPSKVFNYIDDENNSKFKLRVLMTKEKFDSFPKKDADSLLGLNQIAVEYLKIKDPNNPANLKDAILIKFNIEE